MDDAQVKEKIKNLFESHQLTVISTIDSENDKPESAVVAFAEKEDLSLIFGTSNQTRKYKNLQKNKNVSFVIGWSSETGSVQYEGVARELSDDEAVQHGGLMVLKNRQTEEFVIREDQRYFLVIPKWIRYVDTSLETGGDYELNF
jgi:nitroimidazol reductase NimA-like FMN-containing flavoprotein (pyridoxamine 5'-phosphate oxidase superfamily)